MLGTTVYYDTRALVMTKGPHEDQGAGRDALDEDCTHLVEDRVFCEGVVASLLYCWSYY